MKKFIDILRKLRAAVNLLTILVVIAAFLSIILPELDFLPIEKTIVILVGFIIGNMLFERIAITEKTSEFLASISESIQEIKLGDENLQDFIFFENDLDASEMMRKLSLIKLLSRVEILSSGLTSRQELIPHWLKTDILVDAFVQDPETALDKKDKDHVITAIDWIHRRAGEKINHLEIYFHTNISTVRAVVLHEKNTTVKYIFLSWYYYYNANKKIEGVSNPTLYCSTATKHGSEIYRWLNKVIEVNRQESSKANIMELLDESK